MALTQDIDDMTNEIVQWRPQLNTIYHMDALTLLRALPDASVDLCVTDPPYGINYESSWTTRKDGGKRVTSGTFGRDVFDGSWLPELARVMKSDSALYMFTRWDVIHLWKDAIEAAGLKVVQRIVWDKEIHGMGDLRYYSSRIEDCLFVVKGNHKLRCKKRPHNYWLHNKTVAMETYNEYVGHPTQKPEALIERAILNSSDVFNVILDPFMGSGTTAIAARNLNRNFIGCDITESYVRIANERLQRTDPYQSTPLANGMTQLSLWEAS